MKFLKKAASLLVLAAICAKALGINIITASNDNQVVIIIDGTTVDLSRATIVNETPSSITLLPRETNQVLIVVNTQAETLRVTSINGSVNVMNQLTPDQFAWLLAQIGLDRMAPAPLTPLPRTTMSSFFQSIQDSLQEDLNMVNQDQSVFG